MTALSLSPALRPGFQRPSQTDRAAKSEPIPFARDWPFVRGMDSETDATGQMPLYQRLLVSLREKTRRAE
jgi:hypothetical protein